VIADQYLVHGLRISFSSYTYISSFQSLGIACCFSRFVPTEDTPSLLTMIPINFNSMMTLGLPHVSDNAYYSLIRGRGTAYYRGL
jgi:hypothetical protein